TVTALGTLGGTTSQAYGINNNGLVVGRSQNSNGVTVGFTYSRSGPMTPLGIPGGKPNDAFATNNMNEIVGDYYAPGSTYSTAYLYTGSKLINLGSLNGTGSVAHGLNDL